MAGDPGYTRWVPSEWLRVAVFALPLIDKGGTLTKELLDKAQRRALPKARHRDLDSLKAAVWTIAPKYIEQARAMTPEQRAEIAPPPVPRKTPAPRKKLDEGRDYSKPGQSVRWTTLEKARVARQVDAFKAAGDKRVLGRLIIEAQELVVEPDRRRPVNSIRQGSTYNDLMIEEGRANAWLLDEVDEQRKAEAETVMEIVTARPETAAAPAAALPIDSTPRALSEAAKAFGDTVMSALDKLLAAHAESIFAKFSAMASTTSAQIAARIEQGMRETVHQIVEAELGGPVSAAARRLRVDVFGFPNKLDWSRVQSAFNGRTDLRFFNPDDARRYVPEHGSRVLFLTERIPPAVMNSIEAAGIKPTIVKSSTGEVIEAIKALHEAEGVPLAQH